jgi:hypothetical protein
MAERNETLVEGEILFRDLKSKRKTERITARALSKIVENKTKNTTKLRDMHRRASLFSIKYVLANVTEPMIAKEKKATVKFYNELAESKLTEDEMQKKAKQYVTTLTGNKQAYKVAMDEIKFDGPLNLPEVKSAPKKKPLPKPAVEIADDSDTEVEEKQDKLVGGMIGGVEDNKEAARIKQIYEDSKKFYKQEKKEKIRKANYVGLSLGKQAPVTLTSKQKKELGGDFALRLRLVYDHGIDKWFFDYNDKQNSTTAKIVKDIGKIEEFITKAADSYMPHLQQYELAHGTSNALRIVYKAFLKGKSVDKYSEAVKKADAIMTKLENRAELNKEKGLTFDYEEQAYVI